MKCARNELGSLVVYLRQRLKQLCLSCLEGMKLSALPRVVAVVVAAQRFL